MPEFYTIAVSIAGAEIVYAIAHTRAPKSYDHGNTIEVAGLGAMEEGRLVLVQTRDLEWSCGRYLSGLYSFTPAEGWVTPLVGEWLWKRLLGEEAA